MSAENLERRPLGSSNLVPGSDAVGADPLYGFAAEPLGSTIDSVRASALDIKIQLSAVRSVGEVIRHQAEVPLAQATLELPVRP